ncbi:DUF2520 domain-containing protein [Hymenobacter seoulensis]
MSFRIVIIGAGRVAQHLVPALALAGHQIVHVWSRTLASAQVVTATLPETSIGTDLQALPSADIYLLAIPDAAVPEIVKEARFAAGAVVAHTAGALPLSVFAARPELTGGVLYPLQTFSPGRIIQWATVPFCVEAASTTAEHMLWALATSLSEDVRLVNSAQRLQLHVAAVWACNFTNHLLGISHALLQEARLPWELLHPLIRETLDKALSQPPFTAQTGPAVRQDTATLTRHEAALAPHPEWQAIYKALTISVQEAAATGSANNAGQI